MCLILFRFAWFADIAKRRLHSQIKDGGHNKTQYIKLRKVVPLEKKHKFINYVYIREYNIDKVRCFKK